MSEGVAPKLAPGQMHPLLTFTLKTVIVAVAVTLSLMVLMDNLIGDVGDFIDGRIRQIAPLSRLGGHEFWRNLERQLDKAAAPQNELPPERQAELLRDVRVLADRARPFILEAEKAFMPQPATTQMQNK